MNRRSFLRRILAAAVAAPAMDKIVSAAAPKPSRNLSVLQAEEHFLKQERAWISWKPVPLPDYSQGGVMDSSA